jgi:hypothetical protein
MSGSGTEEIINQISGIVGNPFLADALYNSITVALESPQVHLKGGEDQWAIFESSLNAAIRDIDSHPLGKLFRRLIEYGPHDADDPAAPLSDNETILSDLECAEAVEFIYSNMINRFKGELAELLAIKPLLHFKNEFQASSQLPSNVELLLGDTIREKQLRKSKTSRKVEWSGYAKGADGLLVSSDSDRVLFDRKTLRVHGIVEVKSAYKSPSILEKQLHKHLKRFAGGLILGETEWKRENIILEASDGGKMPPQLIVVTPANWKIDRRYWWEQQADKRVMHFPDPPNPTGADELEKIGTNRWRIKLAWSREALSQAAYEMTYWYMSQVGQSIYSQKQKPKGWEKMTAEEIGYNAIKMMLYYIPLRIKHMRPRHKTRIEIRKFR